jgi:hypothetical protein
MALLKGAQEQAMPNGGPMQGQPQQQPQQPQGLLGGQAQQGAAGGFPAEKQQMLEGAVQTGKNVIYDEQIFGQIVQEVDSKDPADALANAIVIVLLKIEEDQSVGQLPLDVALATGLALLSDVVDALTETGRKYDDGLIQQALEKGVQLYLQLKGGNIDQQELQSQIQQLQSFLGGA